MKLRIIVDNENEEEIVARVHADNSIIGCLEELVSELCTDEIVVHTDDELMKIKLSEAECITVIDRKTYVVRDGRLYRTSGSLCEIESRLPSTYIRINKSTLANEKRIAHFKSSFSGGVDAVFKSGYKDYVSRRCFAEIKRRYKS